MSWTFSCYSNVIIVLYLPHRLIAMNTLNIHTAGTVNTQRSQIIRGFRLIKAIVIM